MSTAIAITTIIAATVIINSVIVAMRDIARDKHQPATCKNCGRDTSKENEA